MILHTILAIASLANGGCCVDPNVPDLAVKPTLTRSGTSSFGPPPKISVTTGGQVVLYLAHWNCQGDLTVLLGSLAGAGLVDLGACGLPIEPDWYTAHTLVNPFGFPLSPPVVTEQGPHHSVETVLFQIPAGSPVELVGVEVTFAFLTLDSVSGALVSTSNAADLGFTF